MNTSLKMEQSLYIARSSVFLRQQVVDVLRQAITDGRFAPGTRLVERELCQLTGVSRTSVREALRHLEAEGLVKSVSNRGPIVAELTIDDARAIYDIREALETLAARRFAELATDGEVKQLQDQLEELQKALAAGDLAAMGISTKKLYDILLQGCRNTIICDVIRGLQARVGFLRSKSVSYPGRAPLSVAEMEDIVSAISRRDPAAAEQASARHVRNACSAALAVMQERQTEERSIR